MEYRQDRIVIEMSPHAGEEEGRGEIQHGVQNFFIFFTCGQNKIETGAYRNRKNKLFIFIFEVVIKERKNTSWFSENKFQHEAQK